MQMTLAHLQKICIENELYKTPELNDVLYCNFKGFSSIGGLEQYTALKALFLEGNALQSLDGLPCCNLSCLYLQGNRIEDLSALKQLANLKVLDVSSNDLSTLEGIQHCPGLTTLISGNNKLSSLQSVSVLSQMTEIATLDLQNNRLEDSQVMELLTGCKTLCSIYVKDNPFVARAKDMRKTLIAKLPRLAYADDRPVFELERCTAEAWLNGGSEGEAAARANFFQTKRKTEAENLKLIQAMRAESFRKRREELGLPPGDTDPFYDTVQLTDSEVASEDGSSSSLQCASHSQTEAPPIAEMAA